MSDENEVGEGWIPFPSLVPLDAAAILSNAVGELVLR